MPASSDVRSGIFGALIALVVFGGLTLFRAGAAGAPDHAMNNLAVSCEPDQRALVRQNASSAAGQVTVECITTAQAPRAVEAAFRPQGFQPAVLRIEDAPVLTGAANRPAPRAQASAARPAERAPSWQKRALVIGGSAGAGAGVGALIGGKKGALIGAAIGGGGAAIVDVLRDRD